MGERNVPVRLAARLLVASLLVVLGVAAALTASKLPSALARDDRHSELVALETKIAAEKAELEELDARRAGVRARLEKTRSANGSLRATVAEQGARIALLQGEVAELSREIEGLGG